MLACYTDVSSKKERQENSTAEGVALRHFIAENLTNILTAANTILTAWGISYYTRKEGKHRKKRKYRRGKRQK